MHGVEGQWAFLREVLGSVGLVFISFRFLYIEAAASDHVIEVHCCYYLGGLLGGPCAGTGGLGGIYKGGYGLVLSCMISFPCLCVEVAVGDHPIEVHCCCCLGGLLGGIGAGRGRLCGLSLIGFVRSVVLFLFPSFSFTLRPLQVVRRSRSIVVIVRVDSEVTSVQGRESCGSFII